MSMDKLEREKMMVRGMMNSGMTLAEVARELEMDRSTVYTRYNEIYAPAKAREEKKGMSKVEKMKDSIKKEEEKIIELEKKLTEVDEEINRPLHRSYKEECEYRERHDKDPKTPGAVPVFDEGEEIGNEEGKGGD